MIQAGEIIISDGQIRKTTSTTVVDGVEYPNTIDVTIEAYVSGHEGKFKKRLRELSPDAYRAMELTLPFIQSQGIRESLFIGYMALNYFPNPQRKRLRKSIRKLVIKQEQIYKKYGCFDFRINEL
jgi:hypothetical protein